MVSEPQLLLTKEAAPTVPKSFTAKNNGWNPVDSNHGWIIHKQFIYHTTLPNPAATSSIDSHSLQITQHKLNETNFGEWLQAVLLVIKGKGKADHYRGNTLMPEITSANYGNGGAKNSMIMAWLINSMAPKIGRTYLFYKTAKEIWEAAQELYSDMQKAAQCFKIRSAIQTTRQGNMTVMEHYNTLTELQYETGLFYKISRDCPTDGIKYSKMIQKECIFYFL